MGRAKHGGKPSEGSGDPNANTSPAKSPAKRPATNDAARSSGAIVPSKKQTPPDSDDDDSSSTSEDESSSRAEKKSLAYEKRAETLIWSNGVALKDCGNTRGGKPISFSSTPTTKIFGPPAPLPPSPIISHQKTSSPAKNKSLVSEKKPKLAPVARPRSEWDDHTCDICSRIGHPLSRCMMISPAGDIPGCPLCETVDHLLDDCPRLPDVRHRGSELFNSNNPYKGIDEKTLKELWFKLVVRPGLACIRTKRFSWPEMALHEDLKCHAFLNPGSYPFSIEFAKRWRSEHPGDWETFDYKTGSGALTPHDPATWSICQIRNNPFLVEKFRTPQNLAAEKNKRREEEKLAKKEGRETRQAAWMPMRQIYFYNPSEAKQVVGGGMSLLQALQLN